MKDHEERGWVVVDQILLPHNRDEWWDLLKVVMNFDEMKGIL